MGSGNEIVPGGLLRFVNIKMAALEPCRFEPERVRDVADDESSEDNELNEREHILVFLPKMCSNVNAERVYLLC